MPCYFTILDLDYTGLAYDAETMKKRLFSHGKQLAILNKNV